MLNTIGNLALCCTMIQGRTKGCLCSERESTVNLNMHGKKRESFHVYLSGFFFYIFIDPQLEGKDMSDYDSHGDFKNVKYLW